MECIIANKIKKLFDKIVEPNFVLDSYYVESLISKFSDPADKDIAVLDATPFLSDLLTEIYDYILQNSHNTVKVFVVRMIAVAVKKELHFSKMFCHLGDKISGVFKEALSPKMNSSLKVAYMEVALSIVEHHSGVIWLFDTGVWKEILSLANEKQTVFVIRQTYKFVSKFMWWLNKCGKNETPKIKVVFDVILSEIFKNNLNAIESISSERVEEIAKAIDPSLQMLLSILSEFNEINQQNFVSEILVNDYIIIHQLFLIFNRIRNDETSLIVSKCAFLILVTKIFQTKPLSTTEKYTAEDFMDFSVWYFNYLHELIRRRNPVLILDFCNAIHLLWGSVFREQKINDMLDEKTVQLQNQLLFLCLMPALVYAKGQGKAVMDEKINENILQLVNMACEHSAKVCFAYRDFILELEPVGLMMQSVKRLTCLKNSLNKQQANFVFQVMFYTLTGCDILDCTNTADYGEIEEKVKVLTYVMDIILSLVKTHDINWQGSIEILCLFNVVSQLLQKPNLSCKFVVISLNVIALTVKKFLPPNLSLLMESQPGMATHELDKLIYLKMQDLNWEVRDSALELLLVCTTISHIKFPPFRKQITESKLINVAMTLALNDHEYYVQVSALRCVAAASKVKVMWDQLEKEHPNVQDLLITMLCNNQEGIVRKEACNVLCEIYQNLKLTPAFLDTLYEHMASAAIGDFHWEVQLSALKFWRVVINSLLSDQGMLDGTFPPVTFSRETRKIVHLNEAEVQIRLMKVLEKLSEIGCLAVLIKSLNEEIDIDVMESALSISQELLETLLKYNVPGHLEPSDKDANTTEELICDTREETASLDIAEGNPVETQESDNVIEGILKADDINLLRNVYQQQMSLRTTNNKEVKPKVKLLKRASPYLFVKYTRSKDFKEVIDQRRTWKEGIKSLNSLLDDVLGEYEVKNYSDVNSLDCY